MDESSQPWDRTLIPIDIPASEHVWKIYLTMLNENDFKSTNSNDENSQVISSHNLTNRDERIFKKSILPNGAENITVVVMSKPKIENDETALKPCDIPSSKELTQDKFHCTSRLSNPGSLNLRSLDRNQSTSTSNFDRDHAGPSFRSNKYEEHCQEMINRDIHCNPVRGYRDISQDNWNYSPRSHDNFEPFDNVSNKSYNFQERYNEEYDYYNDCHNESYNRRSLGPHRTYRHKRPRGRRSDPEYYRSPNHTPAQKRIERLSNELKKQIPVLKKTIHFNDLDTKTDPVKSNKSIFFEPERGKYDNRLSDNSISNEKIIKVLEIKKENVNNDSYEHSSDNLDYDISLNTFVPKEDLSPIPQREAKKRTFGFKDDEFSPTESKRSKHSDKRQNDLITDTIFYQSEPLFKSIDNFNESINSGITSIENPSTIPQSQSPSETQVVKQPATDRLLSVKNFARCQNVQKTSEPITRDLLVSIVSNLKNQSTESEGQDKEVLTEEGYHHSVKETSPIRLRNILPSQCLTSQVEPNSNNVESMEWEEIPYEVIDSEIKEVRKNSSLPVCRNSDFCNSSNFDPNSVPYLDKICIVLDTNVILSSLDLIKKLSQTSVCGIEIIIVIPWQVLSELDCLKSKSKSISTRARAASSYLSEQLSKKHPNLKSQPPSLHDSSVLDFKPEIPDDYILLTCLQLKQNNHQVALITNDKNLMAKSEATEIPTFSELSIMKIFDQKKYSAVSVDLENTPSDVVNIDECKVAHRLAKAFISFLTECVKKRVKERYGSLWPLYMLKIPPWNFLECIRNARVHWDIINDNTDQYYEQLSKLNSIEMFFKDTKYGSIDAMKLPFLFDNCCSLAESIPYTDLAGNFVSQANKIINENLKPKENSSLTPTLDVHDRLEDIMPVNEERANHVIELFDLFSRKVITICGCLYKMVNLKWPLSGPTPGADLELSSEQAEEFHSLTKMTLENIISGLKKIMETERGKVNSDSPGVSKVYKHLTEFINEKNTTLQDIIHFANCEIVRRNMASALNDLENLVNMFNRVG